jgi:muramoyltetrapeptide carboxypeptidase
MLTDPNFRQKLGGERLRVGRGEGPIIAGNLSVLVSLLGTPWDVDYAGAVLVLEEVGEPPYKLHRMFLQLAQAGKLDSLSALCLGRFHNCTGKHGPGTDDVFAMLVKDILKTTKYPVIKGLPIGHYGENQPLPVGCRAVVENDTLTVLESPLV